jgi:hypothetical protein
MKNKILVFLFILYFTSGVFAISNVNATGAVNGKTGINTVYNMGVVPPSATLAPSKVDQGADQVGRYILYSGTQLGASAVGTGGSINFPILLDTKTGKSWQYAVKGNSEGCWIEMNRYEVISINKQKVIF